MQQTRTDPPYIPMRARGWPTRRSPRWLFAAGAVLLVIAVAVGLAHHPTKGERATDLRGLLQTLNADVGSCAAGVKEALTLLRDIDTGASHDLTIALSEVNYGAANCSPANNEQLDDLTGVQVPESLSSYHLANAVTALINWAAPDAIRCRPTSPRRCPTTASRPRPPPSPRCTARCVSSMRSGRSCTRNCGRPSRRWRPTPSPPCCTASRGEHRRPQQSGGITRAPEE